MGGWGGEIKIEEGSAQSSPPPQLLPITTAPASSDF